MSVSHTPLTQRLLEGSGVLGHDVSCNELGPLRAALEYVAIDNQCSLPKALEIYNRAREQEKLAPVKAAWAVSFDLGGVSAFEMRTLAVSPIKALANVIAREAQQLPVAARRLGLLITKAKESKYTSIKMVF